MAGVTWSPLLRRLADVLERLAQLPAGGGHAGGGLEGGGAHRPRLGGTRGLREPLGVSSPDPARNRRIPTVSPTVVSTVPTIQRMSLVSRLEILGADTGDLGREPRIQVRDFRPDLGHLESLTASVAVTWITDTYAAHQAAREPAFPDWDALPEREDVSMGDVHHPAIVVVWRGQPGWMFQDNDPEAANTLSFSGGT